MDAPLRNKGAGFYLFLQKVLAICCKGNGELIKFIDQDFEFDLVPSSTTQRLNRKDSNDSVPVTLSIIKALI